MQSSTRLTLAALLGFAIVPCVAFAQGDKPAPPVTQPSASSDSNSSKPEPKPYALTLVVKETSSGKAVQEKNYTLTVIADDKAYYSQNLRDGDRIPYSTKDGQNYQDVGTNIDAQQASRLGDSLVVTIQVDSTSLVATPNFNPGNLPQISQWRVRLVAVLPTGKPTVIYSATDAISGHKVEITATAQTLSGR